MRSRAPAFAFLVAAVAAGVGACRPSPPSIPPIPPGATSIAGSPGITDIPSGSAGADSGAPGAGGSGAPGPTAVPGFEDFQTINAQAVRISVDDGDLVMDLIGSVLWFNADRGVLLYRDVTGDFRATATVRTARASEPGVPPGRDGTVQLAGLMARTEVPAENSVFIVTGSIGGSTGVESKTTTDSRSIYAQRAVGGDGSLDLRLCRRGAEFKLLWRPAGSADDWTPMATFDRPDMPATVQVGPNIYTDAVPDLEARFEGFAIEPVVAGEAC